MLKYDATRIGLVPTQVGTNILKETHTIGLDAILRHAKHFIVEHAFDGALHNSSGAQQKIFIILIVFPIQVSKGPVPVCLET